MQNFIFLIATIRNKYVVSQRCFTTHGVLHGKSDVRGSIDFGFWFEKTLVFTRVFLFFRNIFDYFAPQSKNYQQ